MTLRQLIDKATFISRQVSSAEIPVVYNGVSDNLTSLELSQDNSSTWVTETKLSRFAVGRPHKVIVAHISKQNGLSERKGTKRNH